MDSLASSNGPPSLPKKNRTWVWYFVILAGLSLAATTTMIVYNLRQQLTPEQLEAARQRWLQHGPASYDMEYTKITTTTETYRVEVRDTKVVKVEMTPGLPGNDAKWQPIEERLYPYHSVPALFGFMNDFLARDRMPGRPRAFVRANFDSNDGHLMRYVRSVSGTTPQRVEIVVTKFEAR
jgi:hypothetical protein